MEKLGGEDAVIAYWNAAEPHLQAKFCHNSLGTKIKAERVGAFEYFNEKIVASQSGLNTVMDNAKSVIGNADLVVYMANDESSLWGVIGIAWCPVICSSSSSNPWKTSINEWRTTSVAFGGVILFSFCKDDFILL